MELRVAETKAPRVAFMKRDLQVTLFGPLAGEADQIAGSIEPGDMRKSALRKLERMSTLATAQIENAIVALQADTADQKIDFVGCVSVVLDYVAVGFEVERVEQGAPPIRGQMTLEVGHRTQCPRANPPILLSIIRTQTAQTGAGRVRLGG